MPQKVAHNIFSLLLAKVFSMILVFIGYAFLLRYLGNYQAGQFQFVISYVLLFWVVVDFGIQALVIKKVSEDLSQSRKYLGNFFAVELVLALGVYALLSLIAYLNHYEPAVQHAIYLTGFGMFLNALSIPFTAIISAHEDMHVLAVINFFDSVINFGIMLGAVLLKQGIVFLALVQVLMGVMHLLVYSSLIRKYVPNLQFWSFIKTPDRALMKGLFRSALPFGMLVGFGVIYNKIDVVILQHIRGYAETGLYTTAYKFFDLIAFFPAIVSSSLYPHFASKIQQGKMEEVKNSLQNYTRYMIAAALPLAFGGALLAPKLIAILGGQDFLAGFAALQVLVFGAAILLIYSAANSIMISQLTRYAVIITCANVFVNIIGNILLTPRFGFMAAASMTVVSELVQAVAYFYFVRTKIVNFHVIRFFTKPLLASAIMVLVLFPIRNQPVALTISIGFVVYAIVILLLKYFKPEDLSAVRKLVLRRPVAVEETL
jgi:O-antigen/teichoic acid export membrane protein